MGKGMTSEPLKLVMYLILAITALVLIWYFHEKLFAFVSGILLEGLKNFVISVLKGILGNFNPANWF